MVAPLKAIKISLLLIKNCFNFSFSFVFRQLSYKIFSFCISPIRITGISKIGLKSKFSKAYPFTKVTILLIFTTSQCSGISPSHSMPLSLKFFIAQSLLKDLALLFLAFLIRYLSLLAFLVVCRYKNIC